MLREGDFARAAKAIDLAAVELESVDAEQAASLTGQLETLRRSVAGAASSQAESLNLLRAQAERAWPAMVAEFDARDGFDSGERRAGLHVRFKDVNNRVGLDYASDDFPFVARFDGKPFAGKFDPVVAAALAQVRREYGEGAIDISGWDVIGIVEPGTVQVKERKVVDARDVKPGSGAAPEGWVWIDVPLIRIVALRAGPVAVAVGTGMATRDGTVTLPEGVEATPSNITGAAPPGNVWLWRLFTLAVGVTAAAACLTMAGYAPVGRGAEAGPAQPRLSAAILGLIGLLCAGIGLALMFRGPFLSGLLTHTSIVAAGLYSAAEWLQRWGLISPSLSASIRQLGLPIGLACAGMVSAGLLLGLIGLNLYIV